MVSQKYILSSPDRVDHKIGAAGVWRLATVGTMIGRGATLRDF
jgi:hypothetical protein